MKRIASLIFAGALLCSAASAKPGPKPSPKQKVKLSDDLLSAVAASPNDQVRVLVQWSPDAQDTAQIISGLGGTVLTEFDNLRGGVYLLPSSAVEMLSDSTNVRYVSIDRKVHRKLANAAAAIGAPTLWKAGLSGSGIGVAVIDSGMNFDGNLGKKGGAVYSEDFTGLFSNANPGLLELIKTKGKRNDAPDWFGHGQHIGGIIASNGASSRCLLCTSTALGIAPGVSLINLKALDAQGVGNDSDVIAALDRAISLKKKYNIRVINMSLGRPVFESYKTDPLCQAVEAAWKAGIVVVVSAGNEGRDNSFGNDGYGTVTAPGNDPYVITVGAMKGNGTADTADDRIASYSSKGPSAVDHIVKPDIVAPGNQIMSLRARNSTLPLIMPGSIPALSTYQRFIGNSYPAQQPAAPDDSNTQPPDARIGWGMSPDYLVLSGTSMAAAVVSGAVADLLQAQPRLTPDQVKMLLMKTASKSFPDSSSVFDAATGNTYTSYYDIFTVGAGYLNAAAALAEVNQVPEDVSAISPTAVYNEENGDVNLVFDPNSVFADPSTWNASLVSGDRSRWGASSIWSNNFLYPNGAMWAARSRWGASSVDSERSRWGASGIFTERSRWGASSLDSERSRWGASSMNSESVLNGEK